MAQAAIGNEGIVLVPFLAIGALMPECYLFRKQYQTPPDEKGLKTLRADLAKAQTHAHAEIWIEHVGYPAIRALINGKRAVLLYLRHEKDGGYLSLDPKFEGELEDGPEIEFLSAIGEQGADDYPPGLTLTVKDALRILEWFAVHKCSPPDASWYNQSDEDERGPYGD